MYQSSSPAWLITGCATSFGRELAHLVLERRWRAVVTARNPDQIAELVKRREDNALALKLGVTNDNQAGAAVTAAQDRFGQIDVLVNNAGYGYLADMTIAVLPATRARRSSWIVDVSFIGDLASFGATGYYHATKHAVEGLSGSPRRKSPGLASRPSSSSRGRSAPTGRGHPSSSPTLVSRIARRRPMFAVPRLKATAANSKVDRCAPSRRSALRCSS